MTHEGYHRFERENGKQFGSFEVFYSDGLDMEVGWFWAAGFPGCLWDTEPEGPFPTALAAFDYARGTNKRTVGRLAAFNDSPVSSRS